MKYPRLAIFAILLGSILLFSNRTTLAKDEWLQVRSRNFYLIGNASEKDIKKVGTRLEQFRETFRLLFAGTKLTSPIPTNVIVFKSDSAFRPFKPLRNDGKADKFLAGYFQPGEDVNWIAVSTEGDDKETFSVIFHEYVHFIVNTNFGKSEIPPWFNEGLAEYYSTFEIDDAQKIKLGLPETNHLYLLQQSKLIPLDQLFKVNNEQLIEQGSHSRSIFYAESWALIHYLLQSGKSDSLSKFLGLLLKDTPQEKAFQDAFQMTYPEMESELKKYVNKASYQYNLVTLKNKLDFDSEMTTAPLEEAESNALLGDLLYHTRRQDEAEPFLLNALKLKPELSAANTSMGMVKIRQRKFDDAKTYLQKAIAEDLKNHAAYYWYAFLLSREGRDEFGYVRSFPKESADKMRDALRKSIAINPQFTESYELLAFVDLVNNEELDDAVSKLQKALQYQPGNQRYALRIAEIYSRQDKLAESRAIAEKLSRTADDNEIKSRADRLISEIAQRKEYDDAVANSRRSTSQSQSEPPMSSQNGGPVLRRGNLLKQPSTEETQKLEEEVTIRSINGALREPGTDEKRVLGTIQKIECKGSAITYIVRTETETFNLTSKDFQGLSLNSFSSEADAVPVGCGADVTAVRAVITYKTLPNPKSILRGDLVSLEFVPKNFRLMTKAEIDAPMTLGSTTAGVPQTTENTRLTANQPRGEMPDPDVMRRNAMMQNIRDMIRQPAAGEKRDMGFLDKIECTPKGAFFYMRTSSQTLKLLNTDPKSLALKIFAPDLDGVKFGCNAKIGDVPAVFVYADKPDAKAKTAGEILELDFVPKTFTLN